MKIALLLGIIVIVWGLVVVQAEKNAREYQRGFQDGAASVKKDLDKSCAAWWFDTDLSQAKKRICGK